VHTTVTHHVDVDGTSQRRPCCNLDGSEFWRPNDAANNTRRARIFWSTEFHPIFAVTLPLHTVQSVMPPCPGRHLDTDSAMEDPRIPVLLMGRGNGQSYGGFEQTPMFKNGHSQKDPPGKCLTEESMWNDEETWTECDGMGKRYDMNEQLNEGTNQHNGTERNGTELERNNKEHGTQNSRNPPLHLPYTHKFMNRVHIPEARWCLE
jgi:hypothetical protein